MELKLLRYKDYISEKVAYELLLESELVFSRKFINILSKMKDNKISSELLSLYSKDVDVTHNYIDITDEKDAVSFTPDRKVKELIKDKVDTWVVIDSQRYLTNSKGNDRIFKALDFEKQTDVWAPQAGTVGIILRETVSPVTGRIYVLFQENSDNPRLTILNKEAIELTNSEDMRVWNTSRNNIKVGRLVRAILKSTNKEFTDKDIEDFTNQYKATFDFQMDILKQFDIVTGNKIAYWYDNNDEDRYVDGGGTLNNSCMANVYEDYFNIYCYNPQVSLVILYDDDGTIKDGKYVGDTIKGRAILWDAEMDGKPIKFMDRIYTTNDSDVELFKQFAIKNGWWYKKSQTMDPQESITNGTTSKSKVTMIVRLEDGEFTNYPYMDTMCYLIDDNTLTNNSSVAENGYKILRDTDGGYLDEE